MKTHNPYLFLLLILLSLLAVFTGLAAGSVKINLNELWQLLAVSDEPASPLTRALVLDLRLPRVLSAFAVGGLLAMAGALMQVLLRNPLADPYILGISGGSSVAALGLMLLGISGIWITAGAFAGGLASMFLVFHIAHGKGSWTPTRLLLTGVVIAAGWGAVISFLLAISPTQNIKGMLFWLMGDLSQSSEPTTGLIVLVGAVIISIPLSRNFDVLGRGELRAMALGINLLRNRSLIYVMASLMTATAVSIAGSVGFVGLIIPHSLRLLGVRNHRVLLPACALLGGSLLVFADTLARTIMAPQQLPVGVITAFIGVPIFLVLLGKTGNQLAAWER